MELKKGQVYTVPTQYLSPVIVILDIKEDIVYYRTTLSTGASGDNELSITKFTEHVYKEYVVRDKHNRIKEKLLSG